MIKAIVVDDEPHAQQMIKTILQSQFKEIEITAEAGDVSSAIEIIHTSSPDLLFLDVDLPDGKGFDILKQVNHKSFRIIFITAYQEYALQAIKFSAFDYILKPVNPAELIQAVNNCLAENINAESYENKIQTFFSNFNNTTPEQKKIVLKTSDKIHIVDIKNIIRCESDNSYCTIFLNNGKSIVVSKNLKSYDEMLSPFGFMRVHQSHLINCNYISYFDKLEGGTLVMSDSSRVPISNQKKPVLLAYLESL